MEPQKQPKAMFYIPGIIILCLGMVMLGKETPDVDIRFGADFYTEVYQAVAQVADLIKTGVGLLLMAWGVSSLGKGIAEAKRADLVLERLDAIQQATVGAAQSATVDAAATEPVVADVPTPTPTPAQEPEPMAEPESEPEPASEPEIQPEPETEPKPETETPEDHTADSAPEPDATEAGE